MRLERSLPLLGLVLCVAPEISMELREKNRVDKLLYSIKSRVRVQASIGTLAQQDDTEAEEDFLVEISGTTVTITCPLTEGSITWDLTGTKSDNKDRRLVLENHDSSPANVSCSGSGKTYQMYLNARVCANCEELDALAVTGIITADLLITFGVLILVYYFSKDRKGRASASAGSRPRGQKVQRPPPVPNPDYEPIRKGQREVYAGLESRGF